MNPITGVWGALLGWDSLNEGQALQLGLQSAPNYCSLLNEGQVSQFNLFQWTSTAAVPRQVGLSKAYDSLLKIGQRLQPEDRGEIASC